MTSRPRKTRNPSTKRGAAAPKRRKRVAIILDLDWPYRRQIDVFQGIHEYAAQHSDWECVLLPIAESLPGEVEYPTAGVPLSWDGIITRATAEMAEEARRQGIAIVNVWSNSPVADLVPTVVPDYGVVGRHAARHLVSRGLRRLAYLGFRRDRAGREEYAAMRNVVGEIGGATTRLLIRQSYNRNVERWNEFQRDLHAWLDSLTTPFGVLAVSDLLARYVAEACQQRGLRVPEDVAVIGTGDDDPICLHPEPGLSTVACGYKAIGYAAAELLNAMMDRRPHAERLLLRECVRVVARHSTDVFAVDDALVADALRYISEHCHEPINVSDVIDHVPSSRRSLERRFAKVLNRTIADEIGRMRIQRLERFLVESDEPLEVLASQCGFSDAAQMRRNFLNHRGMNPSEYREEHRS
jgi:LacI family transcriptional regulator